MKLCKYPWVPSLVIIFRKEQIFGTERNLNAISPRGDATSKSLDAGKQQISAKTRLGNRRLDVCHLGVLRVSRGTSVNIRGLMSVGRSMETIVYVRTWLASSASLLRQWRYERISRPHRLTYPASSHDWSLTSAENTDKDRR